MGQGGVRYRLYVRYPRSVGRGRLGGCRRVSAAAGAAVNQGKPASQMTKLLRPSRAGFCALRCVPTMRCDMAGPLISSPARLNCASVTAALGCGSGSTCGSTNKKRRDG